MAKESEHSADVQKAVEVGGEEKNFDLEKAMQHLEKIVNRLDSGNVGLDEAFRLFEEGSRLSEKINKKINSYERKLQILNEQYQLENFDGQALINENNDDE